MFTEASQLLLFLPLPKERSYVFTCICLSVCRFVCLLDYSKSYEQILMELLEEWVVSQGPVE